MESGNTSEWDALSISGDAEASASSKVSKRGDYSLALTVNNAKAGTGVRAVVKDVDGYSGATNLPTDAYYSAWFYVPTHIKVGNSNGDDPSDNWNFFQWKQIGYKNGDTHHKLLEALKLVDWGDGYGLRLQTRTDPSGNWDDSRMYDLADSGGPVFKAGNWFHVEVRRIWHETDGRLTVWVNGKLIWDLTGIKTLYDTSDPEWDHSWAGKNRSRIFSINNYVTGDHSPNTHTLYVDDTRIALGRQGP